MTCRGRPSRPLGRAAGGRRLSPPLASRAHAATPPSRCAALVDEPAECRVRTDVALLRRAGLPVEPVRRPAHEPFLGWPLPPRPAQSPLVVTTAFQARDWLAREWGADVRRIHVIRSEVSLPAVERSRKEWRAELGLADGDLAACMLGHLHVGKDHDTLLRAWRLVVDALEGEGRRCVLLLAGRPAGTHHAIKALAFDLGAARPHPLPRRRRRRQWSARCRRPGGFSSRSEALGRGATEPMYAGLPVAATDVPGIREAVGEPGCPSLPRREKSPV